MSMWLAADAFWMSGQWPTYTLVVEDSVGSTDAPGVTTTVTYARTSNDPVNPATNADSFTAGLVYSVTSTDSLGSLDPPVTMLWGHGQVADDSLGSTDTNSWLATYLRTLADTAGLTDFTSQLFVVPIVVTSQASVIGYKISNLGHMRPGVAASTTPPKFFSLTVTDSLGLTDSASFAEGFVISQTDVAGLSDSNSSATGYGSTYTDLVGLSDPPVVTEAVYSRTPPTDSVFPASAVDSITTLRTLGQASTDSVGSQDPVVTFIRQTVLTFDDSLGSTDTFSDITTFVYSFTDPLGSTDSASTLVIYGVTSTDTLGSTDPPLSIVTSFSFTQSETAGLTDVVTTQKFIDQVANDSAGLSDSAPSFVLTDVESDTAGLTDAANVVLVYNQISTDNSGLSDTSSSAIAFGLVVTDSAGSADTSSTVTSYAPAFTDSLGSTDTSSALTIYARTLDDTAGLSDTSSTVRVYARTLDDTAGQTDTEAHALAIASSAQDSTGLSDSTAVDATTTQGDNAGLSDSTVLVRWLFLTLNESTGIADITHETLSPDALLAGSGTNATQLDKRWSFPHRGGLVDTQTFRVMVT